MNDSNSSHRIDVGIAYNSYIDSNRSDLLDSFDFVEVPFELLRFNPQLIHWVDKRIILHCASLSLAGYNRPSDKATDQLKEFIKSTSTPWLGEHLAFITAEKIDDNYYEEYAPGEPYNIGYTVSPVMNMQSVQNVIENVNHYSHLFQTEIILENSPLYFFMPGSTMSQVDFINSICANSKANLLLDLTHLYISSENFAFDIKKEIQKLPLERIIEIHISGVHYDKSKFWDNHAAKAPEIIFELLDIVLKNSDPKAITLEYNWDSNFNISTLKKEIEKVKEVISRNR